MRSNVMLHTVEMLFIDQANMKVSEEFIQGWNFRPSKVDEIFRAPIRGLTFHR